MDVSKLIQGNELTNNLRKRSFCSLNTTCLLLHRPIHACCMTSGSLPSRSLAALVCLVLLHVCSCRVLSSAGPGVAGSNIAAAAGSSITARTAAAAVVATAPLQSNNSIVCLTTVPQQPGKPAAIAPITFSLKDFSSCGRYQFQCSKGITSCSESDQASRTWKWAYVPMKPNTCIHSVYMDRHPGSSSSSSSDTGVYLGKLFPASRHVFCCSGDACNVPDRRLDAQTEVLAAAPKEFATVPSSWRACLTTRQRVGSLVKPIKYKKADGFVACGSFQYKCNSPQARPPNTTTCSAAAVQSGAWAWHYTALTQQQCDRLPSDAARLGLRHAACCFKDNCNMPDRRVDNVTEVVEWTGLVTSNRTG